ncbi:MAG: hypothetical protein RBT47_08515, partial [Anaerolineae bacterium]|nr:hypothetical protein [Anaerolineae bacterium]
MTSRSWSLADGEFVALWDRGHLARSPLGALSASPAHLRLLPTTNEVSRSRGILPRPGMFCRGRPGTDLRPQNADHEWGCACR